MIGRRSIWSNESIIELASQFVATTDEVWRLQNGTDPECAHFRKIADKGHYRRHKSTRQGIYVCTASGILLGSLNTHNADAVLQMMNEALQEYAALAPEDRKLPADSDIRPAHRWEKSFPENGLHLTMFARDLPESCNPDDESSPAWNQDRIWFSKQEALRFLPDEPGQIRVGQTATLPQEITARIVRFSIVDTVRGQTSFYSRDEVARSRVAVTVTGLTPQKIHLSFAGSTHAESGKSRGRDYPHGIETKLQGQATLDRSSLTFDEFEWVALGSRWGRTVFNGRQDQLEKSPVGFVIRLTSDRAPLIAPSFLYAYRADWVIRP